MEYCGYSIIGGCCGCMIGPGLAGAAYGIAIATNSDTAGDIFVICSGVIAIIVGILWSYWMGESCGKEEKMIIAYTCCYIEFSFIIGLLAVHLTLRFTNYPGV